MGLLGGSTTTKTTTNPWAPQGDKLKDIFNKAGDIFNSKAGTSWYTGDLYANMDPQTAALIQQNLGYIQNKGNAQADAIGAAGQQLAQSGQAGFDRSMQGFEGLVNQNATQANIDAATQYANNPAIDGMIDAASRDVSRNLYENQITGINRGASASGNMNSSRAGVAEGIAMRGAQDQIGDISAGIRGDAYNHGLGLAEQARTTNMSGMGQMAGMYGDGISQGIGAMGQANDMTMGNFGAGIGASQLFQQDQQGQNDADLARWTGNDTRDQDLLDRYYGVLGAQNWGGTSKSKQKSSGSILGSALGVASTVAAFSDPRLKIDIIKTGELEDGLGTYDWTYIWGEKASGVMADEVEALRPWAMGPTIAGFKTVNYAAL